MPYSGLTQRSYRGTFLSSTANTMHFLFILFFCLGVNTESTRTAPTEDAVTSYSVQIHKGGVVKEFEILNRQKKEFSCIMNDIPSKPTTITGYWKKNGAKIESSEQTVQRNNNQYMLNRTFDIQDLGNYSCIFSLPENEPQATFVFKVPAIKERDKPIVSYIGDSVILDCHMEHSKDHGPDTWNWYKVNGTEKELLNVTAEPTKYHLDSSKNKTKLIVLNLTKEDSGKYVCSAVFNISQTDSRVELKVLSFTEPLKPFLAIAVEVVVLITLILLYEKKTHRRGDSETTENGPQPEQASKLTQDETNGMDGGSTTRQRKVDQ
ncbi:embigin [Colossoma macropomum]|uniref:embigin n=1 Tax=Colossoma macropomum TaxID=42526 RepID=UPI0018647816|nr:embigin [Colossoma macropomum]